MNEYCKEVSNMGNKSSQPKSVYVFQNTKDVVLPSFAIVHAQQNLGARAIYSEGIDCLLALLGLGSTGVVKTELSKRFGSEIKMMNHLQRINDFNRFPGIRSKNWIFVDVSAKVSSEYNRAVLGLVTMFDENLRTNPTGAAQKINKCIESECGLKDVVNPDTLQDSLMILVNILHFKDDWVVPFDPDSTHDHDFLNLNAKLLDVPMMFRSGDAEVHLSEGITAVRLHFVGGAVAEFIMGLPVETVFTQEIKYHSQDIDLYLPKFEHKEEINLEPLIRANDCGSIFSPGDFVPMCGSKEVRVGEAKQIISVTFDELGAEVKATTTMVMTMECSMTKRQIKFDRPFHYRIVCNNITLVSGFYNGS